MVDATVFSSCRTCCGANKNMKNTGNLDDIEASHEETQATTAGAPASMSRKRTVQRPSRALALCVSLCLTSIGALQWFNVYEFQPSLQKNGGSHGKPENTLQYEYDYFAPSINFRTTGRSQYKEDLKLMQHSCLEPVRDLKWEFYTPPVADAVTHTKGKGAVDETKHPTSTTTQKRLLIALYAGYDEYARFLDHSAKIAKLYATLWGPHVTVVVLQGTAFAPEGCQPPRIHTTLNKIRLLFHAIDHTYKEGREQEEKSYDQLLLLDADALLVNMTMDVTALLPSDDNEYLLASGPVRHKSTFPTGVTLWNLHHPQIRDVAMDWFQHATDAVKAGTYRGDQDHLHLSKDLYVEREELASGGTAVRHYKKRESQNNLKDRQMGLSRRADKICKEYQDVCSDLAKVYESTNR